MCAEGIARSVFWIRTRGLIGPSADARGGDETEPAQTFATVRLEIQIPRSEQSVPKAETDSRPSLYINCTLVSRRLPVSPRPVRPSSVAAALDAAPSPAMSSHAAKSDSSRSSTSSAIAPDQLIALPSLSCSLSSLPQAKSLDGVSLHPSSMSAQRAAESEAKVRSASRSPPRRS